MADGAWWRRAVASAPLTHAYLLVLLATTAVLWWVPASIGEELLDSASTDVAHLASDPAIVLVASALWLPSGHWLPYAVVLLMVAAPLERLIGSVRTALVFLSGHVLATLLTEVPIALAISWRWVGSSLAHRLDVGASYGTLAVVAAFAGSLPRVQGLVVVVLAGVLVAGVPAHPLGMTTYGHLLSLLIGVCWWPRLYRPASPWSA